jgi:hypothetical protein
MAAVSLRRTAELSAHAAGAELADADLIQDAAPAVVPAVTRANVQAPAGTAAMVPDI